ncbi:MAG: BrnT family toxin [Sphingomonadales bacterium]
MRVWQDSNAAIWNSSRPIDGEIRYKIVGLIDDRHHTVVFTIRNARRRIISFRKSNAQEIRRYRANSSGPR